MITIVCNSSNEYTKHCRTMLTSLFENNKKNDIQVFILTLDIDRFNEDKFKVLAAKYNSEITVLKVKSSDIPNLKVNFASYNIVVYLRLLAADLLPLSIEKILYFDCDIIVNSDILELWNTDITHYALAATKDIPLYSETYKYIIGLKDNDVYINSGVMLINAHYWRKNKISEVALNYAVNNSDKIIACDQDVINATLQGKFKIISSEWNVLPEFFYESPLLFNEDYEKISAIRKHPKIIHFLYIKPWYKECIHPLKSLYFQYYKLCEEENPILLNFKESYLKTQIKRTIKTILHNTHIKRYYHAFDRKYIRTIRVY